ncbi:hypothetical protein [Streptomyces sp. BBFR109]|uniref:hypothetical protein n=1 Tax=Streptomyces sp. BBFR109 TaxID=3448172 RepID=UPI003F76A099
MTGGGDGLAELLRRAGLDIVGDGRNEGMPPPRAAWRPVISREAEPTVVVRGQLPLSVAELNEKWHRLAQDTGVLGADGVFGSQPTSRTDCRTRVRASESSPRTGTPGPNLRSRSEGQ